MKRAKITKAMDYLDDDLIAGAMETKSTLQGGTQIMTRNSIWTKVAAVAAGVAILAGGGFALTQYAGSVNANAIVAFDVNPSLEIEVNGKQKVVEVTALNADAEIVIGDMNFKNVDLDVTVNALLGSMLQHGYLSTDQNSILISVDCNNASKAATLQESILADVTALLSGNNIELSVITQTFDKDKVPEQDKGGSAAKATLIEKILATGITNADGIPYTYEQLAELKVHDLKLLLDSKGIQIGGAHADGHAGKGNYIDKQQALDIAFAKAEITAEQALRVEIELDFDKKLNAMLYEVEFEFGDVEYEYEINATTGDILKEEIEAKDADDTDDDELTTAPEGCIGKRAALDIAYAHAGISAENARDVDCDLKTFNGTPYFSIEFEVGNQEYEYAVHATTGEIIHSRVAIDD